MMAKDGRSLKQCIVWCDPAVRPDLQNQLVAVGTLADAGVFDAVLDTDHWRKKRINRNNTEWHIRALVFVSGKKSAANPNGEFRFKFLLLVDRANYLVGILTGICSNMPVDRRAVGVVYVLVGLAFVSLVIAVI